MTVVTVHISVADQQLRLVVEGEPARLYAVSTAAKGIGNAENSGCTPVGLHYVRAKIGTGLPLNSVFVGRRFTGEFYTPDLAVRYPQRDWILTRILWLCGLEPGFNRLGQVDSMRRFIYIHGTPDTEPMGTPLSHGCVRMRNADIIELFELVPAGCRVSITAE